MKTSNSTSVMFNIVLVCTALLTALIGGLFYAWSCSVTVGLAKVPDNVYMAAMQSMNREILNPVFFLSFMGTWIMLPICTWMSYKQPEIGRFWFLLAATIIYWVGIFGVTSFGNVPLNDALDKFDLANATEQAISAHRLKFEGPWNRLNTVRTIASVLTILCVILACVYPLFKSSKEL
ncbi:MAG TPA: anthrone oxygenase family protein [Chitinophaga sp.]|uniref:anthrone oxygenase family protein n=1 Tax=Chitinophaga sp. TaxID=1869181 RepID=UPI002B621C27|nr:anthrone oxygenase family protein [Chitinophaga sp.]HVI48667.1 anthrone oxygenase family protein [Chitinophaga sp.]